MSRFYGPVSSVDFEREDRSKVKSAFDISMERYGEEKPADRQNIDGLSFADLRDDMSRRRRNMARRADDC